MTERIRILISPETIEVEIESEHQCSETIEKRAINLIKDFIPKNTKSIDQYNYVG